MIQQKQIHIAQYQTDHPSQEGAEELSDKDIFILLRNNINEAYAAKSRFKGKVMSMGTVGQKQVYKEITKRLNESNIDRVALALSSNDCENYFGMLTEYSHGKHMYFGQSDLWQVYQLLVAGLRTDDGFEDKIQASAGIASSFVRDVITGKAIARKEYHRKRKKTEEVKHRRKLASYSKVRNAVKNSTAKARHKPNKQTPLDACKSKSVKSKPTQKAPTKKRKAKCPNCKLVHAGSCEEPEYPGAKGRKMAKEAKLKETIDEKHDQIFQFLY